MALLKSSGTTTTLVGYFYSALSAELRKSDQLDETDEAKKDAHKKDSQAKTAHYDDVHPSKYIKIKSLADKSRPRITPMVLIDEEPQAEVAAIQEDLADQQNSPRPK